MKHHQSPFGIVPVEVAMDQRLTLQQMRVLLALYTFRNRNTELTHPTREAISERTGMALTKISKATTDLERLGWLTKVGNGGRSQATRYRVHVPETLTDSDTVSKTKTVPERVAVSAHETVTDSVTVPKSVTVTDSALNGDRLGYETVTDSGRGKEHTKNIPEQKEKSARTRATPPRPDGVDEQVWLDWLALRRGKRAPVTGTVLDGARQEAQQAGVTLEAFLREWCLRGTQGLKAAWLRQSHIAQPHPSNAKYAGAAAAIFDGATHV